MRRSESGGWALETLLVHGVSGIGSKGEESWSSRGTPTVQPIYSSTTYLHPNAEALDQAFENSLSGNVRRPF